MYINITKQIKANDTNLTPETGFYDHVRWDFDIQKTYDRNNMLETGDNNASETFFIRSRKNFNPSRVAVKMFMSLWNLACYSTSILPAKCHSEWNILNINLEISKGPPTNNAFTHRFEYLPYLITAYGRCVCQSKMKFSNISIIWLMKFGIICMISLYRASS